jgi:two-component system sensor histidine kinase KdpD
MQDTRRNPDALLALFKEEQNNRTHGRLKIFFGYAPGVGKTYAMLEAARKLKAENIDVLAGVVETHGRAATKELLDGLEILPPTRSEYKGKEISEFDLDAAIIRKPQVILVDEAAHTNAPGSRHEKRWQDIQELLLHGIDVFTTLNTQHIETLNDRVAQITRIEVRERVPDSFVEEAFEIELVDLPVDELLKRLQEGKVYISEQAATALEHFFRKGNLIALREIALLFVAQRVDAQMERYRELHQIGAVWPAGERIMVCISASPLSVKLVRGAKRMATALRAQWLVAYVETPGRAPLKDTDKARVIQTLRLAEQLGAEIVEITGESVSEEIVKCAQQHNVSRIVIGKPALPRWKELLRGSIVDEVIRKSGAIDVYVITGEEGGPAPTASFKWQRSSSSSNYLKAFLVCCACTGISYAAMNFLAEINMVMIYLLGVLFVAMRYGRGPSVLASVLSVAAFDFCFVPPKLTFVAEDSQYLLTFGVMLSVALTISTLTTRVKQQAESSRLRERRTAALYAMSKELASIDEPDQLMKIGMQHLAEVFDAGIAILIFHDQKPLEILTDTHNQQAFDQPDLAVAEWTMTNREMAGLGTNTLPGSSALYLPLQGTSRMIGVLAVKPNVLDKLSRPEQIQLLQTFATQIAQACERAYLSEENERAQVQMKTEQLRSSLLSSVSHDLRTPLATIAGAASSIMEAPSSLDLNGCKERAAEIFQESVRLNRLVTNLLDMTRLQAGTLVVKKDWHPVDEIVGSALSCMDDKLKNREVKTKIAEEALLIQVDEVLIQQVLVNLIENALKYTPEDSPLEISAERSEDSLLVSVADRGPGIPAEHRALIFEKFFREDPKAAVGAGLGLAICHGIVDAHGGKIWVDENPEGGSIFRFTLPIGAPAPVIDPERFAE